MHVGSILRVALSFNFSALSTSSFALSHILLARANSDWASSISLLVSSLTRSAYAFSMAASRICSAACHLRASTYPESNRTSVLYWLWSWLSDAGRINIPWLWVDDGFIGRRTLIESCRSNEGGSIDSDDRIMLPEESDGQEEEFGAFWWVDRKCSSFWWSSIGEWVDRKWWCSFVSFSIQWIFV